MGEELTPRKALGVLLIAASLPIWAVSIWLADSNEGTRWYWFGVALGGIAGMLFVKGIGKLAKAAPEPGEGV